MCRLLRSRTSCRDLARFTVDFAYGDVMSRPGLDLKTRQLCTVAALAAMRNAQPPTTGCVCLVAHSSDGH